MGCLICPNCKNEYTIIPELFKPGSFKCTKCGWSTEEKKRDYEWKIWFSDEYFEDCKNDLLNWLLKYVFIGEGFPIDLLKGRVAFKDGVILFIGYRGRSDIMVEYLMSHIPGAVGPDWLRLDSTGRTLSSQNYYNAWISRNNLDTVFIVDNPKTGFRIMEAFWRAEGRVPDVCWGSSIVPTRCVEREDLYIGKKVLVLGRNGLLQALQKRFVYVSSYLNTTKGLLPQDIYYACRKMEDIANDPRNYNLTVELQMDLSKPYSGIRGFLCSPSDSALKDQVSHLCREAANPIRIPQAVSVAKRVKPGTKRNSYKKRSKYYEVKVKAKTKTRSRGRNVNY